MQKMTALLITALLFALVAPVQARGPWRASESNTRGWQLMTPAERIDHQSRIRSFSTYEECRAYQVIHHQLMEERARQRNLALPGGGRDFCEHLKRGRDFRQSGD
ncbi:MAG: hypothetical protein FIA97_00880 [Methylococcaceae bacterium]|nr:hypothetical protein [Methylococcaceae bacterium]